ncbi:hypothetical protein [Agarilytica rhodophyticola]|uniref:hypothetical protein n=1 Tax=Agarilytica rhodophyticola TaxID=1737490 RepID=UPI0013154713|nr:hypothetical protein [Agarilytica rhodophyticola]
MRAVLPMDGLIPRSTGSTRAALPMEGLIPRSTGNARALVKQLRVVRENLLNEA